jgi:hypothetical protein
VGRGPLSLGLGPSAAPPATPVRDALAIPPLVIQVANSLAIVYGSEVTVATWMAGVDMVNAHGGVTVRPVGAEAE